MRGEGVAAVTTVTEFIDWAEGQPGRYELVDGEIVSRPYQCVRRVETKFAAQIALSEALRVIPLSCEMLPGGLCVPINTQTAFEPDALVYCGERLAPDAITVPEPVIVIEVISPSTKQVDIGAKLLGYFRLPSLQHYLILDTERRTVIHHRRSTGDLIETRIAASGDLSLDPPGLTLAVASLFAEP
ncbi:Uma2 family endonuclease [Methylorubrum extorquens]